jgi:2,5-diamino-6-(ribosylamino)-4(3H)-pyrimidinone 5'-phosphate reductase
MSVYPDLTFPDPPADRPYVFINMVSTIDGKILTGERDEPVMDLGSKTDHATMRQLEAAADAVLIGAGSLRATPGLWYDSPLIRIVVTASGDVFNKPDGALRRFFADSPELAFVASDKPLELPADVRQLPGDLAALLETLRQKHKVSRLLCEGGSELNGQLLKRGLVDELFLTLAPKLKLGRSIPTIAGGEPFSREEVETWTLVSATPVDGELFLRYRR